jgi:hypothetical protein
VHAHTISQPPAVGGTWAFSTPLSDADIQARSGGDSVLEHQLRDQRTTVIQAILTTAEQTVIAAEKLFAECEQLSVPIPAFVLGELPAPELESKVATVTNLTLDETVLSLPEQEHVLEICREAGKTFDQLSDHDKRVLQHSLELYRRSKTAVAISRF